MRHDAAGELDDDDDDDVLRKGDRIELLASRTGVRLRGTVFHVDQIQILVKWDDGRSESLRPDSDRFLIVERVRPAR